MLRGMTPHGDILCDDALLCLIAQPLAGRRPLNDPCGRGALLAVRGSTTLEAQATDSHEHAV